MDKKLPQMIMAIMCDGKSRSVPGLFSELNDMNGDIATHDDIKKALNELHYPGWLVTRGLIDGRGNIEYYAFMKCEAKRKSGNQWFYIVGGVNDFKDLSDSSFFAYTDDGVNIYGSAYPLNTREIMRKLVGLRVSVPDEVMEMAINQKENKMKEFNLEEAKAGKPVMTQNGLKVRNLCFDFNGLDGTKK